LSAREDKPIGIRALHIACRHFKLIAGISALIWGKKKYKEMAENLALLAWPIAV